MSGNTEVLECFLKFDSNFKKQILKEAQKQLPEKYGPNLTDVLEKFQLKEEELGFLLASAFLSWVDEDAESECTRICDYIRSQLNDSVSTCNWYKDQKGNQDMQKVIDFVNSYSS